MANRIIKKNNTDGTDMANTCNRIWYQVVLPFNLTEKILIADQDRPSSSVSMLMEQG
jgi:hypothetical protein